MRQRHRFTDSRLRQAVYDRMADEWGLPYDLKLTKLLLAIMGRKHPFHHSLDTMSDHEAEVCRILLSDNGFTYYKAYLARLDR